MKIKIKAFILLFVMAALYVGCKKTDYKFGEINTPSDLKLTAAIAGADAANPNGAGTGKVAITVAAGKAITYKIDYGDGNTEMVPSGVVTHKYGSPGTFEYILTVNAIGTGGVTSTVSKKITVFVAYEIPAAIVQNLTKGSSQTWVIDRETPGHVGVGPVTTFTSDYYSAGPNERADCLYDDLVTFSKDASNNISLSVDNKGQSFMLAAATGYYGKAGGDNCYDFDLTTARKLAFMDATSASTTANSTRVQFSVPGTGLISFGTGGNTYEIIALTATTMTLRNIGADGLAWYQKFKVKP